ncbi:MAG: short-chain dehydrogenase [Flavobacterium psychrophilum]|nr:MAG: short-chain dehydrogenase [Flavobacterium psychrophilum]
MDTTNNTIFITGGSAGIGFKVAKLFSERGNSVIINGRSKERLENALEQLPGAKAIQGDISIESERTRIAGTLLKEYPDLNVIINNAGEAYYYNLGIDVNAKEHAEKEINTNYLSIIHFTELMLPTLLNRGNAAIVNVSSIAALRSNMAIPTYSASKAALHFYTQALRHSLSETNVKVFELMPPMVNTDFSAAIGGATKGIAPEEVANEFFSAFKNDRFEIPVGKTKPIFEAYLNAMSDFLK